MLGDNQAFKMAASGGVPNVNIQYSDYFAGLEGPAKLRYQEKITVYGFDPYALRKSDFCENIELVSLRSKRFCAVREQRITGR